MDKEIPFTGANANPSFEVVNVVINGYNGKGCFTAQAYVKAARDMEPCQLLHAGEVSIADAAD